MFAGTSKPPSGQGRTGRKWGVGFLGSGSQPNVFLQFWGARQPRMELNCKPFKHILCKTLRFARTSLRPRFSDIAFGMLEAKLGACPRLRANRILNPHVDMTSC